MMFPKLSLNSCRTCSILINPYSTIILKILTMIWYFSANLLIRRRDEQIYHVTIVNEIAVPKSINTFRISSQSTVMALVLSLLYIMHVQGKTRMFPDKMMATPVRGNRRIVDTSTAVAEVCSRAE